MRMLVTLQRAAVLLVLLVLWTSSGSAQHPGSRYQARLLMTRSELAELLAALEAGTAVSSADTRGQGSTRHEVELIRARLQEGDFKVGDQISLEVPGEEELTGNFTVVAGVDGVALRLPVIGDVGLRGVLRSEIEEHLRNELSRFLRDPRVYARSTIRLSILEGVTQPGFYPVAAEDLLTDVLMIAGGPSPQARLDKIRIERGKERIWSADALQQAIIEGRTLDQLSLQAGDRIIIPERGERSWTTIVQAFGLLVPAVYALVQIF